MKRLLLLVCGLSLLGITPSASIAQCTYQNKVLGIETANLIAYWPMTEVAGIVAVDVTGNGRDGVYNGPTLSAATGPGGLGALPLFDGVNDYVELYSSSLSGAWNDDEFTVVAWFKAYNSTVWSSGSYKFVHNFRVSGTDAAMAIVTRDASANTLGFYYPSGTPKIFTFSSIDWTFTAITRSASANLQKSYIGTTEIDSQSAAAVSLTLAKAQAGKYTSASNLYWHGYIGHIAVWTKALNATQIEALADPSCASAPSPITDQFIHEVKLSSGNSAGIYRIVDAGQFGLMLVGLVQIGILVGILFMLMRKRRGRD